MSGPDQSRADAAEGNASPVRLRVLRGEPTPEELAAVIAVVTEAYAGEAATVATEDATLTPAWQVHARALRAPFRRDVAWGRFGGQ
ncbi:acyl-CoA carboxylase subunit epsilon [Microbacterium sp.]|uniref:acyl-CoA carboxylase subunit epsilon n=1 Tax=Microbacterium sp. TaxID=51671 RepID=UPI0025D74ABE|nr:acyl-CoA carboxylase subunit epsilon [Microbacterium sp.]